MIVVSTLFQHLPGLKKPADASPAKESQDDYQFVTAHRGTRYGEKKLPENLRETLLSKDVRAGRIHLETDVYAPTDSDELFIKHDGKLTGRDIGPENPKQRTYDLNTEEMASLRFTEKNLQAHEDTVNRKMGTDHLPEGHPDRFVADPALLGEPISTLQEIVDGMGEDARIYINFKSTREEIKNGEVNDIERKVVDFIGKNDLKDRSTVLLHSPTSLARIKEYDSEVKAGLLTDWLNNVPRPIRENPVLYRMVLYPYLLRAKLHFNPEPLEKLFDKPLGLGADSVHPKFPHTDEAMVSVAERLGFDEVRTWASRETRAEEIGELQRIHTLSTRHKIPVGVITDIPDDALKIAGGKPVENQPGK